MSSLPKVNWAQKTLVLELGQQMRTFEEALRENFANIRFSHQLQIKGFGSGGMENKSSAYKIGEACFLQATIRDAVTGYFWLYNKEPARSHFDFMPTDLLIIPSLETVAQAIKTTLADANYIVSTSTFNEEAENEFPSRNNEVWIKIVPTEISDNPSHLVIRTTKKERDSDRIDSCLLEKSKLIFEENLAGDRTLALNSFLREKFLEYSFPPET